MLRLLLTAISLGTLLIAADSNQIAANILDKVIDSLFPNTKIYAWGETKEHRQMIQSSYKMELTSNPEQAYFVIVSKSVPNNISSKSILFTTEYSVFKHNDKVIGAFYWQKGRPNLLFLRSRLKDSNLNLGTEFEKYIEDEL